MMQHLDMVLTHLDKLKLRVKPEKCQFFHKQLRFLGHLLCDNGISPDADKTREVYEWNAPQNKSRVEEFPWTCQVTGVSSLDLQRLLPATFTYWWEETKEDENSETSIANGVGYQL